MRGEQFWEMRRERFWEKKIDSIDRGEEVDRWVRVVLVVLVLVREIAGVRVRARGPHQRLRGGLRPGARHGGRRHRPRQAACSPRALHGGPPPPPLPFRPPPLPPDDVLEPGRLYFLLPHAALLSSDSSPLDLACLLNRLSALAKRPSPARSADPAALPSPFPAWTPMPSRRAAWRPQLDRIDERSFGRSRDSMRSTAST
uniref:Uncharacterized protein n=1 Tax=Ananas comosus var. bracteatus TaxID=296719 RepID=A0A6V7P9Y3_ANACO|nr:unnamed protein product [Ananas comosus var. bracteatus]